MEPETKDETPNAEPDPALPAIREEAERLNGWRLIETAPKDEEALLWNGTHSPKVARWGDFCVYNAPKFTHWKPLNQSPLSPPATQGGEAAIREEAERELRERVTLYRELAAEAKQTGTWVSMSDAYTTAADDVEQALAALAARTEERARPTWRCFHCDEVFTDKTEAREHFGSTEYATPACRLPAEAVTSLRQLEDQNADLRAENERLDNNEGAYKTMLADFKRRWPQHNGSAIFAYDSMEGRALAAEERVEQVEAALAACTEEQDRLCWQPIETAPKDGTRIILAGCDDTGAHWLGDVCYWSTDDYNDLGPSWRFWSWPQVAPTLWLPLPTSQSSVVATGSLLATRAAEQVEGYVSPPSAREGGGRYSITLADVGRIMDALEAVAVEDDPVLTIQRLATRAAEIAQLEREWRDLSNEANLKRCLAIERGDGVDANVQCAREAALDFCADRLALLLASPGPRTDAAVFPPSARAAEIAQVVEEMREWVDPAIAAADPKSADREIQVWVERLTALLDKS